MAQFDYFGTWDDSWAILKDLLTAELRAYWDAGPHDRPEAQPFIALTDELKTRLQRRPGLYLYGPFSTHLPWFWQQDEGVNAGRYFLSDNRGGPLMTLDVAGDQVIDGQRRILVGALSTQPEYQLEPGRYEKPGPELKAAYQDLVKRMKRHLVRKGSLWIGKKALQLLQAGQAQLPAHLQAQLASARQPRPASASSTPPAPPVPKAAEGA